MDRDGIPASFIVAGGHARWEGRGVSSPIHDVFALGTDAGGASLIIEWPLFHSHLEFSPSIYLSIPASSSMFETASHFAKGVL